MLTHFTILQKLFQGSNRRKLFSEDENDWTHSFYRNQHSRISLLVLMLFSSSSSFNQFISSSSIELQQLSLQNAIEHVDFGVHLDLPQKTLPIRFQHSPIKSLTGWMQRTTCSCASPTGGKSAGSRWCDIGLGSQPFKAHFWLSSNGPPSQINDRKVLTWQLYLAASEGTVTSKP